MNYYSKHIGDFNNKTRHLSRIERSLFSDAIELYYSTERPLISDINKLSRLLLATTEEEKDALKIILNEFFILKKDVYRNKRCDEELAIYNSKCKHNQRVGKLGGRPKKDHSKDKIKKPSGFPKITQVVSKYNPNQEPVPTPIPIPIPIPIKDKTINELLAQNLVKKELARDWLKHREKKKAQVTETVINIIDNESRKAKISFSDALIVSIERNWVSFKADWYLKNQKKDKFDGLTFVNKGRTENLHEKLIEN